ncbi:SRPBCC family protein [Neobacillus dielmonensis]|uniref:SRPBCC family protein n=1 Tax=Neobacillus dielmonensis TaxID=1347369 RepID=UPI0005A8FC49|nr:SRPBCC family protein [Neobacillus dielmonensis]
MPTQITTKFMIQKPANEVFEAIVDPKKIGNFWFSSSSERWEPGKMVTLKYDEYGAEVIIKVEEVTQNKKIVFSWGETIMTITLTESDHNSTIIQATEAGFNEEDPELINILLDQKEGWVYVLSCLKAYLEHGVTDLRAALIH